jgi:hypothetical protein
MLSPRRTQHAPGRLTPLSTGRGVGCPQDHAPTSKRGSTHAAAPGGEEEEDDDDASDDGIGLVDGGWTVN